MNRNTCNWRCRKCHNIVSSPFKKSHTVESHLWFVTLAKVTARLCQLYLKILVLCFLKMSSIPSITCKSPVISFSCKHTGVFPFVCCPCFIYFDLLWENLKVCCPKREHLTNKMWGLVVCIEEKALCADAGFVPFSLPGGSLNCIFSLSQWLAKECLPSLLMLKFSSSITLWRRKFLGPGRKGSD